MARISKRAGRKSRAKPRARKAGRKLAKRPPKKRVLRKPRLKPRARPKARKIAGRPKPGKVAKTPKKILVGRISHYFSGIGVGVVELSRELKIGDEISIEGTTTNFSQKVASMQIDRAPVTLAKAGQSVGIKVRGRVRQNDRVFLA